MSAPASPAKKFKLHFCPCGSGKPVAECHLDFDGCLRKHTSSLISPGKATGFSHPSCYLRSTLNCSEQISREHYMSKSVLDQLGEVLRISGVPWLKQGESLDTAVGSLTAKILCKRHNEALSPLDQEAAHFFSVLRRALVDLKRKTLSRKPSFYLVSGDAIELWMLKVACGLYFAVGAKDGTQLARTHTIDITKVRRAFFEKAWDFRGGLYFRGHTGSIVNVSPDLGMAPLTLDSERRFGGAVISLHGFTLEVLFDTTKVNAGPWTSLVRRPTELVLKNGKRQHHIILTWPPGTPEASVVLEEGTPAKD
jgi:hypothetical protein